MKKEQKAKKATRSDDFLKSQAASLFATAKTSHDLMSERMREDMDQYDGKFSSDEKKFSEVLGIPRLFINKTYTNTQRIVVDIIDTIFFDPEEIVDVTAWKSIPYENRQIVKSLMNYRLNGHPIDFYKEIYELGLDAVRNTVGVLKVYPELDLAEEPVLETLETEFGTVEVDLGETETVVKHYEPRLKAIPPEDVFFSQAATWKDYYRHPIIHRYKETRDYLKGKGYKNVDVVSPANEQAVSDEVKTQRFEDFQSPFNTDTLVKAAEQVWVYEIWDFLPGEDGRLVSCSYVCLGDESGPSVVARGWEENQLPYKFDHFEHNRPPFIVAWAYPEPHRFEGKSFPWITAASQREINAIANQEREAVARALRPTTYINRDANVDLAALITRRIGGYTQGDGPASEAIQELAMSNPLALTQGHRAQVNTDYWDAGIPPNLLGNQTNEETATAANQQLVNANKKVGFVVKNIVYTAVLPALQYLLRLEQVYATDEFVADVTGRALGWQFSDDEFPPRKAIQGDFDLKVNLGVNKRSQINQLLLIMDRLNQANMNMGQLVQFGVVQPQAARIKDPMRVFEILMDLSGFKDRQELDLPMQAPPQMAAPGGVPSQAGQSMDPAGQISQTMPMAPGALNVVG